LDWLNWKKIVLISLVGALLVGAMVYVLVPRRWAAHASILVAAEPDIMSSLGALAASQGGGGAAGALGALGMGAASPVMRMQQALQSDREMDELIGKYRLRDVLKLDREKTLKWLTGATKIDVLGQGTGLTTGGGVGLSVQVTLPGSSRLQDWLHQRPLFTTSQAQQLCADLANDYISLLDRYMTQTGGKSAQDTRVFVEKRMKEVQTQLKQTENRLVALQTKYQFADPTSQVTYLLGLLGTAAQANAQASADAATAAQSLVVARSRLGKEQVNRVIQKVNERNPVISTLEDNLAQLRMNYATQLASGKSAQHPDVVALQMGINDLEKQLTRVRAEVQASLSSGPNPIRDAVLGQVINLEVALAGARARQAKFSAQVAQLNSRVSTLPPVARDYVRLTRDEAMQTDLLGTLTKRLDLATIEEKLQTSGQFQPLDTAVPPDEKAGPSGGTATAGSFVLLLLALTAGVLFRRGMFTFERD
jgi:uncharacterized protein involved in exopolysaccharide biosynthesis